MKNIFVKTALLACLCLVSAEVFSQCPMCRMTAESNLKDGGTVGAGLNAGILYMLVAPYLIVMCVSIWWWRNRKKEGEAPETVFEE